MKSTKILSLDSTIYLTKHYGKKVRDIIKEDPQYLLWLQQSHFGLQMGKSVLEALGVWNNYKDTSYGKQQQVLTK